MKRNLFGWILIGILLLSYGCSVSQEQNTHTDPVTPTVETTKVSETVTTQATHSTTGSEETPTEVTTTATQPATTATEPTVPTTTAPMPTETVRPTKPTEPSKPSENTKPSTPQTTKPTQTVTPDEAQRVDWLETDSGKYYLHSDGSLHTGWLTLDGERYYFHEDGTMAVGKVQVPGSGTRYFTSTGKECILVNPWNYVPDDYSVKLSKYGDYKVAKLCLDDLKDMLADCKSAGNRAVVVSAYRSNSYQANLYERRVQRFIDQGYSRAEAEIEAAKRVAIPGTSEHELGLGLDIVDVTYQNLDKKQEETAAQQWLIKNSWKYGFILRYPNGKSDVTGIIYEPWHYRYVGKELAEELHSSGLCLEEYFEQLA